MNLQMNNIVCFKTNEILIMATNICIYIYNLHDIIFVFHCCIDKYSVQCMENRTYVYFFTIYTDNILLLENHNNSNYINSIHFQQYIMKCFCIIKWYTNT